MINKRVSTSDGNAECCQQSVTGKAAFPYGTTNTQRQADTLEQLSASSSSSHHHKRTICSEQIRALILLRFCIFRFCANEGDTFGIHLGSVRLVFGCNQTICSCSAAGCPVNLVQGITANWEVLD